LVFEQEVLAENCVVRFVAFIVSQMIHFPTTAALPLKVMIFEKSVFIKTDIYDNNKAQEQKQHLGNCSLSGKSIGVKKSERRE